jgi:hypothetical protein
MRDPSRACQSLLASLDSYSTPFGVIDHEAVQRLFEKAVWQLYESEPEEAIKYLHQADRVLGKASSPVLWHNEFCERLIAAARGYVDKGNYNSAMPLCNLAVETSDGLKSIFPSTNKAAIELQRQCRLTLAAGG